MGLRTRVLNPLFFSDRKILKLEPRERLLFQALWCKADRLGLLDDEPFGIWLTCAPIDFKSEDELSDSLNNMQAQGLIKRLESGGVKFLYINNFNKYQTPHKNEAKSIILDKIDKYKITCDYEKTEYHVGWTEHEIIRKTDENDVVSERQGKVVNIRFNVGACVANGSTCVANIDTYTANGSTCVANGSECHPVYGIRYTVYGIRYTDNGKKELPEFPLRENSSPQTSFAGDDLQSTEVSIESILDSIPDPPAEIQPEQPTPKDPPKKKRQFEATEAEWAVAGHWHSERQHWAEEHAPGAYLPPGTIPVKDLEAARTLLNGLRKRAPTREPPEHARDLITWLHRVEDFWPTVINTLPALVKKLPDGKYYAKYAAWKMNGSGNGRCGTHRQVETRPEERHRAQFYGGVIE